METRPRHGSFDQGDMGHPDDIAPLYRTGMPYPTVPSRCVIYFSVAR